MTPQDKAAELVDKFTPLASSVSSIFGVTVVNDKGVQHFYAKKSALVTVHEIISVATIGDTRLGGMPDEGYAVDYWVRVIEEIENL